MADLMDAHLFIIAEQVTKNGPTGHFYDATSPLVLNWLERQTNLKSGTDEGFDSPQQNYISNRSYNSNRNEYHFRPNGRFNNKNFSSMSRNRTQPPASLKCDNKYSVLSRDDF